MILTSILVLIVAKALPSLYNNISNTYFIRISAIVFLYAGLLSLNTLYYQYIGSGIVIYSGFFQITNLSVFIEFFLLIIGSIILIAWPLNNTSYRQITSSSNNTENLMMRSKDYSLIVLFSTLGSCLLISSSDLISMYLSIELQSFGLYVLATLYRESESSTKAGLKYFLLGGLSSCLILLGSGLIYAYTGLTNFESIYSLLSAYDINNITAPALSPSSFPLSEGYSSEYVGEAYFLCPTQMVWAGIAIIIIGFLFKISAAPLHNWSPDVYDETPTIVTIWLTIMPKIAILILLLELITHTDIAGASHLYVYSPFSLFGSATSTGSYDYPLAAASDPFGFGFSFTFREGHQGHIKNLLLVSSLLSLIIGTVVGLAQTRIKRLLAYSTISHIGFILLALLINTEQSIDSLIFYIIQYSITNLNIFLILIALSYIINNNIRQIDIKYISDLKGQFFLPSNPLLSLSLAICLFSMAGIPPLIGFFSKQFVLYSALQSGYYFISIVAIIVSVISASYYLKVIKVLQEEVNTLPIPLQSIRISTQSVRDEGKEYCRRASLPLQGGEISKDLQQSENLQLLLLRIRISSSSKEEQNAQGQGDNASILTNFHSFIISTLTLSILFFIFKPSLILNSTQLLSLSLFNC